MMMWQPIETAPRNQTFLAVLNCAGEQTICTMRWPVAEAKNSRPDSKTFHVERVTHWMPLPDLPGAQALPAENAVAYLDLGTGGYMDVGTDLTDEELAALPKGRHMLGIIGTYGVDGYVPAQPAPSLASVDVSLISEGKTQPAPSVPAVPTKSLKPVIDWLRNGCDPMRAADELELLIAAALKPEAKL